MLSCSFRKKTPAMASIPFPLLLLRGPNLPGMSPVNGMAMEAWSRLYKEMVLNRTSREYILLHISLVDVLSVILPLLLRLRWKLQTLLDLGETLDASCLPQLLFQSLAKMESGRLFKNILVHSFVWL
ncbi:hypothetical protein ACFX2I_045551 [Malus domestica]